MAAGNAASGRRTHIGPGRAPSDDLCRRLAPHRRAGIGRSGPARGAWPRTLAVAAAGRLDVGAEVDQRADGVLVDPCGRAVSTIAQEEDSAMTDAATVRLQRVMPATPDAVFDEWLDRDSLREWMCPRPVRVLDVTVEPHVGGIVRFD